ncbi:MAG: hypothetical protein GY793_01655 [Proteobacteria bacterium]|nr:hypothetical protein [Pseudomonadota bacterium]
MIKIEEGLELNNPTLEIKQITYDQLQSLVIVECIFREENANYQHSRSYAFDSGKDMLKADVMELLKGHEILKQLL